MSTDLQIKQLQQQLNTLKLIKFKENLVNVVNINNNDLKNVDNFHVKVCVDPIHKHYKNKVRHAKLELSYGYKRLNNDIINVNFFLIYNYFKDYNGRLVDMSYPSLKVINTSDQTDIISFNYDGNKIINNNNNNNNLELRNNELLYENNEIKQCSICLSDFKNNDHIFNISNCNHIFHFNCLNEWFKRQKKCPLCRCDIINEQEVTWDHLMNKILQYINGNQNHWWCLITQLNKWGELK